MKQKTLKNTIEFSGVGLHSGLEVSVKLIPKNENFGIRFKRTDLPESCEINADYKNVISTQRSVTLGRGNSYIKTVEHLLAALYAYGIDNLLIEANGGEIPAVDGSAAPFTQKILETGILELPAEKECIRLKEPVNFKEKDSFISAYPGENLKITVVINFNHPLAGYQVFEFEKGKDDFFSVLSPARTFGFWEEIEFLKKNNLALGGSPDNAIIIKKDKIMTKLRFDDEIVRHKCLDLIGDMALLGKDLKAHICAYKSSHGLDIKFLKKIAAFKEGEMVNIDINEIFKILPHRYPFLLVDRVLELVDDKRAVGIKNVTYNEPFFMGHFPEKPIMPGVLIIEALAQIGGIMLLNKRRHLKITPYFTGIDKVRIRKAVIPGDQILLTAEVLNIRGNQMGKIKATATVNGRLVTEGELMFALVQEKAEDRGEDLE